MGSYLRGSGSSERIVQKTETDAATKQGLEAGMIRTLNARLASEAIVRVDELRVQSWRSFLRTLMDDTDLTKRLLTLTTLVRLWLAEALYRAAGWIQPKEIKK